VAYLPALKLLSLARVPYSDVVGFEVMSRLAALPRLSDLTVSQRL
jgi:hypothetical protein